MLLGLRTVIYPTASLEEAKNCATRILGVKPYFDQPFYVGYNVAGYEFALDPNEDPAADPTSYWGVADVDIAVTEMVERGATVRSSVRDGRRPDPPRNLGLARHRRARSDREPPL